MPTRTLTKLDEPKLMFALNQAVEDPRDGLTLFGPLDKGKPYGIRAGVVGTLQGIGFFKNWVQKIQMPVIDQNTLSRPFFPGFEEIFRIPWNPSPLIEVIVDRREIEDAILLDDAHNRVYKTVDLFTSRIIKSLKEEEDKPDVWFIVIPDDVYKYCRPKSIVSRAERIESTDKLSLKLARQMRLQPSLFSEDNIRAIPYQFDIDFRNQLKARLIPYSVTTQVIRESTIAFREVLKPNGKPLRDLKGMESVIAWNISTAAFYKSGGRPWKINEIREGVCYVGLVFKKDERSGDSRNACCGAQMFLDSGDGIVFKGAVGPWYNDKKGDFHLSGFAAKNLMKLVIDSYRQYSGGKTPRELFIHGKVNFDQKEWEGFISSVPPETKLVGIQIRDFTNLKLFRRSSHPILRGQVFLSDPRTAFLWTKGYVPRLQTYPGREVPDPLIIHLSKGEADMQIIVRDIMSLTKLNYNSCKHSDGLPVTLRFADAIGEILTAGPVLENSPLPFKYYI